MDLSEIRPGMEVFAIDGELIGTVTRVRPPAPAMQQADFPPDLPTGDTLSAATEMPIDEVGAGGLDAIRGYGTPGDQGGAPRTTGGSAADLEFRRGGGERPQSSGAVAGPERPGVIMVEDPGTFGVGARGLRVPSSAVIDVMPGRRVTLDCTRTEAGDRYGSGPSLDIDEDAEFTPF